MMPLSAKLEDAVTGQWLRIGTKEIFTGNSSMCNDVPSCAERRLPFADVITLNFHFDKHKNEFSFASEIEYQIAADAFMSGIANPPVKECTRITGDRVRFDRKSGCFAVGKTRCISSGNARG
jgi:pyocin large subunit-like protein